MEISLESATASSEVSLSSIEKIANRLLDWAMSNGVKILIGLIILGVGWKLIKKLMKIFNSFSSRKEIDSTLHSFLGAFLELALKALLIICVLGYVGFEITGLAALLASAGFALGLALQGSLSNFAGGVIILIMRPFQVGDFIESSSNSGTVEKIDRNTSRFSADVFDAREASNREECEGEVPDKEAREEEKITELQLLPHIHGTDGFFISRFIKRDE